MRLMAMAGLVVLGLGFAPASALALTCMFRPFQAFGERFGPKELIAHVEVLDVRADRTMDVRVLRVLHGREARPIIAIDAAGSFGWNMARQWGFEPFARSSQWVVVLVPAREGASAWQLPVCRAYLKVESGVARGPLADVSRMERVRLEGLAARIAAP